MLYRGAFCDEWEIDELDLERDHQSQEMRDIALSGDGQLMRERVEATCLAIKQVPFALLGELSSGASFAVFDELSFGVLETEVSTKPDIGVIDVPCGTNVVLHEDSPSYSATGCSVVMVPGFTETLFSSSASFVWDASLMRRHSLMVAGGFTLGLVPNNLSIRSKQGHILFNFSPMVPDRQPGSCSAPLGISFLILLQKDFVFRLNLLRTEEREPLLFHGYRENPKCRLLRRQNSPDTHLAGATCYHCQIPGYFQPLHHGSVIAKRVSMPPPRIGGFRRSRCGHCRIKKIIPNKGGEKVGRGVTKKTPMMRKTNGKPWRELEENCGWKTGGRSRQE
ncbi:hypothetical protein PsorP6_001604 [Peronosclerospora sorghi]|uniref:Uncharacterized protein n=1 Tax=Peronosclerospora sorghi TaxID=230839 RepID=A0ACC0WU15_9STRA|nr:hypothetical protein PsorP6_001604 [Peronosclerospora sorghi]